MQLGMIGLGRMGANLVRRLQRDGHTCVVYDRDPAAIEALAAEGATPAASLAEMAAALEAPRAVWVMVPAAFAAQVVDDMAEHLDAGDIVIDGGNSFYQDDIAQAAKHAERGIHHVDIGTSGGVFGLDRGFSLMVGGVDEAVERLRPVLSSLAAGVDSIERTPGKDGETLPGEEGWLHCGPPGAGHFVKMVHNGIEYGIMAAYAEGLNLLSHADEGSEARANDAETAPLRNPEHYQYDIDIAAVTEVWRRGSVIGSWLLDLTATALHDEPELDSFEGRVSDSGEGRWTVQSAIDVGVPVPVLSTALYSRFASRDRDGFANKVLSAMRKGFGGHHEKKADS